MSLTQTQHQQLRNLLAQQKWDEAQTLWLDLAEQLSDQPDLLLHMVKDFADAGQKEIAAELASLLAPTLKSSGKQHEWLFALKLQTEATPNNQALRTELNAAYQQLYQSDPRLKTILAISELERQGAPLPAAVAKTDTLLALKEGAFCQHKSWGSGRVKTFDANLNRIVVGFPHNPAHAMQLAYAADSLMPVSAEHIEVRKLTDLNSLKELATRSPLDLLRVVLHSYNRSVAPDRLEAILSGSVIPAADWKKWSDNLKKLAKRDPHLLWPLKKTEPIVLRDAPVAQQDELLEAFHGAPSLTQKTNTARQFLKIVDEISDPELMLQEFQDGLLESIRTTKAGYQAERLEAALLVEELRSRQRTPPENTPPLVAEILGRIDNLPGVLDDLSASAQKRAIAALKLSQPDRMLKTINYFSAKVLDELADVLPQASERIGQLVQNQSASPELLYWICKNNAANQWLQDLQGPPLVLAVFAALEGTGKSTKRLHELLLAENSLLVDLLAKANTETIRGIARQLMTSSAFEELDRRSLMARLIKEYPFVQEMVVTKSVKEQPLVVSWASYHRRQAELDEIIQKKIPQNSKEIGEARSYGDLRENFEFKAAKDMQKLLMRRRGELEALLSRAQATDFAEAKTDIVSIGTSVTVTDITAKQQVTYHILGAWDSDPARGVISYPAALAQALLNKKPGDTVEAAGESVPQKLRIERIEKIPEEILKAL